MRQLFPLLVIVCVACGSPAPCADDPARCQDAGTDGPEGPGSCTGICLPHAPEGWLATSLLWTGQSGDTAPACPSVLPGTLPGFADTPPAVSCPACKCSPSAADCLLPEQLSANATACPGGSGGEPFNTPKAWDGTCDTSNPVASASSLTVSPPPSPIGSCSPVVTGQVSIQGATPALVCSGTPGLAPGTCGDQSMVCAFPKTDGFLTCITAIGDQQCPASWPTRHVVYLNSQACGCQCGDPVGDSCAATLTVYADDACSQPLGSTMVSSDQPKACVDVAPGSAFKSKASTPPVYTAGTCAPSSFDLGEPFTVCCVP